MMKFHPMLWNYLMTNLLYNQLKSNQYGYNLFQINDKPILKFFVEDTGIGVREDSQKIIFDLFRQADGSLSRQYEGMGIGLATAKKLTNLLGGDIWVDSVLGKGSTFFFTLPIAEDVSLIEMSNVSEPAN